MEIFTNYLVLKPCNTVVLTTRLGPATKQILTAPQLSPTLLVKSFTSVPDYMAVLPRPDAITVVLSNQLAPATPESGLQARTVPLSPRILGRWIYPVTQYNT
jgi:hypothetical protein